MFHAPKNSLCKILVSFCVLISFAASSTFALAMPLQEPVEPAPGPIIVDEVQEVVPGEQIEVPLPAAEVTGGGVVEGGTVEGGVVLGEVVEGGIVQGEIVEGGVVQGEVVEGGVVQGQLVEGVVVEGVEGLPVIQDAPGAMAVELSELEAKAENAVASPTLEMQKALAAERAKSGDVKIGDMKSGDMKSGDNSSAEVKTDVDKDKKYAVAPGDLELDLELADSAEGEAAGVAATGESTAEGSEEGVGGLALPASGTDEFLKPSHFQWIWKAIAVLFSVGLLLWFLSLMSPATVGEEKKRKREGEKLDPSKANSKANSLAGSGTASGSTAATGSTSTATTAASGIAATGTAAAASSIATGTKTTAEKSSVPATASSINESDFGNVFARKPATVDDLTKIGGIDASAEKRLNEAGIWQYDQLRSMTAQQRANLQRKFNLPRIRWYSLSGLGGVSAAAAGTAAAAATATVVPTKGDATPSKLTGGNGSVSSSTRVDSGSGSLTGSNQAQGSNQTQGSVQIPTPKFQDDLTRLPGVDAKLAAELNKEGIYNFKQLQSFSPAQKLAFEKRFGIGFDKLKVGEFASGSATVSAGQGGPSSTTGSGQTNVSGSGSASTIAGAAAAAAGTVGAIAGAAGLAKSGKSPADADPASADKDSKTNESSSANEPARKSGYTVVSGFAGATATASAAGTASGDTPEEGADDLTRLAGVDADAAKRLNAAGIHKFEQLEGLDQRQMADLARRCNLQNANVSDWRRCVYAWGRGIDTQAEVDRVLDSGMLNGIKLPKIATGVFDGGKLISRSEQVIFRGSNPEGWGTGHDDVEGVETSISCDSIRSDINYLRLRRTDTQESIVVPMTKGQIFANSGDANGWNGSSEVFFGGRHVGAFAQHLPQEVETKFSEGGWGFGHRYDHNDRQEWGWAGRVIEPTTFEVSVGCVGQMPGTVVFRSSDPSIWNSQVSDGDERFAVPVSSVKHPVNFVRMMRLATGEAVIVRVDGSHLLDEGFDPRLGWNGSCCEFSGGNHLGVYHSDLPQDFETRFEFGGWGFGHPYNDNDRQAWGWAGRQLPETVFEISLLESVPEFMQHEVIE